MKTTNKLTILLVLSMLIFSCQKDDELVSFTEKNNAKKSSKVKLEDGISVGDISDEEFFEKLLSSKWEITEFISSSNHINTEKFIGNHIKFYDNKKNDKEIHSIIRNDEEFSKGSISTFSSVFLIEFGYPFFDVSNYYKKKSTYITDSQIIITNSRNGETSEKLVFTAIPDDGNTDSDLDNFTKSLQGTWKISNITNNGRNVTDFLKNYSFTFKENYLGVATNEKIVGTDMDKYAISNFFYINNKDINDNIFLTIDNFKRNYLNNSWQFVSKNNNQMKFTYLKRNGVKDELILTKK